MTGVDGMRRERSRTGREGRAARAAADRGKSEGRA